MSCHVMSCHVMSYHVISCHEIFMQYQIMARKTFSSSCFYLLFCLCHTSFVLRPSSFVLCPLSFADRALAIVNGQRHAWPCSCFTSELSCGSLSLPEEGALSAVHVARVARGLLTAHTQRTFPAPSALHPTSRTRLLTPR